MSVITRVLGEKTFTVHTKGAPEIIAGMCKPGTVPDDYQKMLSIYTEKGYRVLALAYKTINVNFAKVSTYRLNLPPSRAGHAAERVEKNISRTKAKKKKER